ncbi:hypothetical protein C8R41DRAFT_629831 [Lentinula lateritia]|uniref:DEK-C domain-containing protein n=1 Tax=Lentinula lateritia TaxID=40482 RepID=A0ABQ8V1A0_9AGAR|nr:hypothetical protein C8R41DRAFT_629831 [Lentinula lateritia]
MPEPDPKIIREMTRKMVLDAGKNGTLSRLTPRTIRERLENDLGLEDHALKPFKDVIKDAITKALDNEDVDEDEEEHKEQRNVEVDVEVKKKNTAKEKKKKAEGKPPAKKSSNKPPRREFSSPEDPTKGKKRKSETADGAGPSKTKKPRVSSDAKSNDKKAFESAAVVPPSSDFEDNIPAKPTKDNLFSADETTPKKPLLPDNSKVVTSSNKALAIDPEEQPDKSESELSVLIDEPPKRKKKGKAKEPSEANENKERKKRGTASATLSKDEETIKRLKSLINACGVRKVWSKMFKDISDSPSRQIALLRKMLADLGMTGRLSMDQAKSIKEKRELASELADVQSFEQTIKNQSSRRSRSAATKEDSAEAESEKDSDEENVRPAKRKSNARQSIMAFLENQSDSE